MRILNYGLKTILSEHQEDFTDPLFESGIDVEKKIWDYETIINNAERCADILKSYMDYQNPEFFPIVLNALREKRYFSIMAYIFFAAECQHAPPPYGIIQHAIDDKLLEEFCIALQKELFTMAEMEGHWDWLDSTKSLPTGYWLK